MNMNYSTAFEFVIGVNPGYFHDNPMESPLSVVVAAWDKASEESFKDRNFYIPAVLTTGKAVYRREWGCPEGGEDIVIVRGNLNPQFVVGSDTFRWSGTVMSICERVKELLDQKTGTLCMFDCKFAYLNG